MVNHIGAEVDLITHNRSVCVIVIGLDKRHALFILFISTTECAWM